MSIIYTNKGIGARPIARVFAKGSDVRPMEVNGLLDPFDINPVGSGFYSGVTSPDTSFGYSPPASQQQLPAAAPFVPAQTKIAGDNMRVPGGRVPDSRQKKSGQADILSALYADPSSARGRALQAAAAAGLQLSGYQDRPMTTGQILGAMAQAGTKEYGLASKEERQRKQSAAEAAEQLRQFEVEMDLKRRELDIKAGKPVSEAGQAAVDAGLTPGTQEFRDFVKKITQVPMTEKEEIIFKEDYASVTKEIEDTNSMAAALPEWQKVESMLLAMPEGEETGKLEDFLLPFKGWAKSAGFLDGAEVAALERAESLNAAMKVIIPKMRAIGSGATSDFEFKNFEAAATSFGKTKAANLIIASTMRQTIEHKIKVTELKRELTRELNQAPSPEQLEAAMIERGIGSVFNTPFGREIDAKSKEDVTNEMVKMVLAGNIEPNSVVYLGKHAGDSGVNGFIYYTAEMIDAIRSSVSETKE